MDRVRKQFSPCRLAPEKLAWSCFHNCKSDELLISSEIFFLEGGHTNLGPGPGAGYTDPESWAVFHIRGILGATSLGLRVTAEGPLAILLSGLIHWG